MQVWLCGRNLQRELPDESVHCCVTTPPYYALRDYGLDAQIGREDTPEQYIDRLVAVFHELKRVLRPDGTFWLNIADTYCGTGSKGGYTDPKNPKGRNGQSLSLNRRAPNCKHMENMTAALPDMDADMRELAKRTLSKVDALTDEEYAGLAVYAADEA